MMDGEGEESGAMGQQYRDKAIKLREEAIALEATMKERRATGSTINARSNVVTSNDGDTTTYTKKKIYTSLNDSSWIISYRFASDPIAQENDDDKETRVIYYSGKVSIMLKNDGYTDLIVDDDNVNEQSSQSSQSLSFKKFWGWDEEISREIEDEKKYLSFSADVILPKNDPNYNQGSACRFYFNSAIDEDSKSGEITLNDCTVTLKRDIEPPGGFWGVFNGGGILAQFRYCGEFLMKPK